MTFQDPLFTQLLPFEWRSGEASRVIFPCTTMKISMQQELAEHGVWGQDVERYEATGRKSLVFTARIPFRNGIVPGKKEKWGVLYPDAYRAFLTATANRSSGVLVHPELGGVFCKVRSVETDWDANRRDGCDVDATWVETRRADTDIEVFANSPVAEATIAALDLDTHIGRISPPLCAPKGFCLPADKRFTPNFNDLMRSVAAVGDQVSLLEQRVAGKIENILYRVQAIDDAASRPGQTATSIVRQNTLRIKDAGDTVKRAIDFVRDPNATAAAEAALRWPIRRQISIIRTSLQDLRRKLLENGGTIVLYTVPRTTTIAGIVSSTGAKLSELMKLNPELVRRPAVPAGTIVRYYNGAD